MCLRDFLKLFSCNSGSFLNLLVSHDNYDDIDDSSSFIVEDFPIEDIGSQSFLSLIEDYLSYPVEYVSLISSRVSSRVTPVKPIMSIFIHE